MVPTSRSNANKEDTFAVLWRMRARELAIVSVSIPRATRSLIRRHASSRKGHMDRRKSSIPARIGGVTRIGAACARTGSSSTRCISARSLWMGRDAPRPKTSNRSRSSASIFSRSCRSTTSVRRRSRRRGAGYDADQSEVRFCPTPKFRSGSSSRADDRTVSVSAGCCRDDDSHAR